MKQKIKKILALVVLIILLLSMITGCGKGGDSSDISDISSNNSGNTSGDSLSDSSNTDDEESSTVSTYQIPDKYKPEAPSGFVGTTEPEFFDELGVFITDKYKLYLGSGWEFERAYSEYTGVYGYKHSDTGAALIVNITEVPDTFGSKDPAEYYQEKIEEEMTEYELQEASQFEVNNDIVAYCYWFQHPTEYTVLLYSFYQGENHTYEIAGSFWESEAAFSIINEAMSTFEILE